MEPFVSIRNGLKPLVTFLNSSISDIWLGSKYASDTSELLSGNFLQNRLVRLVATCNDTQR